MVIEELESRINEINNEIVNLINERKDLEYKLAIEFAYSEQDAYWK